MECWRHGGRERHTTREFVKIYDFEQGDEDEDAV